MPKQGFRESDRQVRVPPSVLYKMGYSQPMKQLEKTDEFAVWFESLSDRQVRARIQVRIDRLQDGNPGDVAPVGAGVSELRLHFGSGWRVYYTERGGVLVILLAGGPKSSQAKDIQTALRLAQNL